LLGSGTLVDLTAGSWFHDRGEAKLYLIAGDKADPATHVDTVNFTERSFDIVDGSYLTIDGFTIKGTISAQVAADDVNLPGLVITNNVFDSDDSAALALEIDGGAADTTKTYEDYLIDNNVFETNSGIRLTCSGRNSTVSDNTFNGVVIEGWRDTHDERNAMQIYGDGDISGSGKQSSGLVIERNFSNYCNGRHIYFRYGIDGVTVQNNIFYGGERAAIYLRDNCTNMVVVNNTFFYNADRDHLAKIYHECSVVCMNNIFAYPQRGYTWFHDNKPDTTASTRLPFEVDYNYYVTDTSDGSSRDDQLLRMRTGPDGYYCDSSNLPGGPHAVYGHPMIARPDSVITPLGETLYFDPIRETMFEAEAAYDSIPDMWFQAAYPLFAGAGVATGVTVLTPDDFMLLEGSNAIDAANPAHAPARDFFNLDRDANPDMGAIEFGTSVAVEDVMDRLFPENYALSQNYPNPFNPATTIEYQLPEAGFVKLTVYNLLGQEVVRLVDGVRRSGSHSVVWNSRDKLGSTVPTGIYFCRMEAGSYAKTVKMLLLK
jgi:hypothetical protein